MDILDTVAFGAPAAERDDALAEYFVESDTFRHLEIGKTSVVIGNRGSGKTALFRELAARKVKSGASILKLNPESYSYEMLVKVLKREGEGSWAKQGAFAAAWKYLIYVMLMKKLTSEGPRLKTGSAAAIYTYLRDNHRGAQDTPIAVLVSYLKRIEGLKIGNFGATLKTQELAQLYKLEELEPLIPHLMNLLDKRHVVVLVDELDKGWDNSEDAQAFVSGLFQAAMSINEHSRNLAVYISLRQELYDSIPALYEDAQKYRDIIETIRWDEDSLRSLVAKRIRYSVPELRQCSDSDCWNAVFAETLQYRKARSFNYMIDRTLYRPREIIQFCSQAVEANIERIAPMDYSVISRAELKYSVDRETDIAAEYRFQYPGLQSVFELFRGRAYTMERADLETLCLGVCSGDLRTTASWAQGQDPEYLIDILWRIGFLRAYAVGGLKAMRRSGSSYVGPHQVSVLNLQAISRFQVHPMFRASLGMKEAKSDNLDD